MTREVISIARARAMSGLELAFFGDAVYEVLVRERIVKSGAASVSALHKKAVLKVNAGFQSFAYDVISDMLSDEETEIFKRGRNASGNNVPRSSNPADYRRATGIEALFGFLYLTGQDERMYELFDKIYNAERT